jgi:hypothetical protein
MCVDSNCLPVCLKCGIGYEESTLALYLIIDLDSRKFFVTVLKFGRTEKTFLGVLLPEVQVLESKSKATTL